MQIEYHRLRDTTKLLAEKIETAKTRLYFVTSPGIEPGFTP